MLINLILQNSITNQNNPQFKSVYPVIYWVKNSKNDFIPLLKNEEVKKINKKLIKILNSRQPITENKFDINNRVRLFINRNDTSYQKNSYVRGFYHKNQEQNYTTTKPTCYILTGNDAIDFEETHIKNLRILNYMNINSENTKEINKLKIDYWKKGLEFVKHRSKFFVNKNGEPKELHIKLETLKDKFGRIYDYKIENMCYFSKSNPLYPFKNTTWLKIKPL